MPPRLQIWARKPRSRPQRGAIRPARRAPATTGAGSTAAEAQRLELVAALGGYGRALGCRQLRRDRGREQAAQVDQPACLKLLGRFHGSPNPRRGLG